MVQRLSLKRKFYIAIVGLILIVLFFGGIIVFASYANIHRYRALNKKIELSHHISLVLHELQRERGTVVGFITDNGNFTAKDLKAQRQKTNKVLREQEKFFNRNSHRFFPEIVSEARKHFKYLQLVRIRMERGQFPLNTILENYTKTNFFMLGLIADFATESSSPVLTKNMLAYSHFLYLQEYVGLERAEGILLLSHPKKILTERFRFSNLLALKTEHKKLFLHYANRTTRQRFLPILKEKTTQDILTQENLLLHPSGATRMITSDDWYRILTQKLGQLEEVSHYVEEQIVAGIAHQITRAQRWFVLALVLVGLSVVAFGVLVFLFLRLYRVETQQRTILDKHIIDSATDTQGTITEVSQAFCDISGYAPEELIGHNHSIVCHPEMSRKVLADMWETLKAGEAWQGKIQNRRKDGSAYWVYAHLEPLRNTAGKIEGYYGVRIDITEMEELSLAVQEQEHQFRRQEELMEHQNRLAQMGEMISMIAHQWRQPLAAVAAVAGSMQIKARMGRFDNAAAREHADKIEQLTRHMSETIDDFRNYYKPDQQKTETNFARLVDGVRMLIENSLEQKGIQLKVTLRDAHLLSTYENKLKQVLINLVKNAEDALVERQVATPWIQIEGEGNTLCVTDNAGGIAPEILPKIFDPYFSTKSQKDGTGLGLYMSKMIIEEHCGGTLNVQSRGDQTRFCIQLPAKDTNETM